MFYQLSIRRSTGLERRPAYDLETLETRRLLSVTQETAELTILGEQTGERSGTSITAVGNNILVGAYLADVGGLTDAGAARLYDGVTGALIREFRDPAPRASDFFGIAVAANASGTRVLVGAYGKDLGATDAGAAYLFDANTGSLLATIRNPRPAKGDSFGSSLTFVGENILIGSRGDDTMATDAGAAYLFSPSGSLLATYFAPVAVARGQFGNAVAAIGNDPVVASHYDNLGGFTRNGAVYRFDSLLTGTVRIAKQIFLNPTPEAYDYFGTSLAAWGDQLLVGAIGDNTAGSCAGAAYLFDATTGLLQHTFLNPAKASNDNFGAAVALTDGAALIGAPLHDTGDTNSGAAYLFSTNSGDLTHTFYNPSKASYDIFGNAVAFVGNKVLVAASGDDEAFLDAGAVYLFDPAEPLV